MKTKWLDRSLMVGPHMTLVLSEDEYRTAMRHCKVPRAEQPLWILTPHADATVHWMDNLNGALTCIVAIRPRKGITGIQIASMLVHEAVHIWQQFKKRIGEKKPSAEFEAYSIQTIAQRLMEAYADRVAA